MRLGQRRQIDHPVQRAVAAAGDQDVLAAEGLHLAHGVMHADAVAGIFELLDAGHRRALGLESCPRRPRPPPRRDDFGAGIGLQLPAAVGQLFQRRRHLVEMELRIERLDLLQQPVDQLLAGDDGQARNVIDRLFRIKLGALAARPVQDVDQMAFEIQQPQLEHGEQADGARADNGDICFDRRAQGYSHLTSCKLENSFYM